MEGLADVRVIRAIYESIESKKPVQIKVTDIEMRPTLKQQIHRPPVSEPEMIHAHAPSR